MAKLFDITGKCLSGEWGIDDNDGTGIPILRTTNFTNEGIINYNNVVTRQINKKNIQEKYLRNGDIIIEKSGGSDNQPVGRVVFFEGEENIYLFNNFTGLLRVKNQNKWYPKYVFYTLFANYLNGGTRQFENKTTGLHNLKTDSYVSSIEIREIPFEKQEKIVKNLDSVCRLIELRKQQLSKLDELVKSRFIELFGDIVLNPNEFEEGVVSEYCKMTQGTQIPMSEQRTDYQQGYYRYLYIRDLKYNDDNWIYVRDKYDDKKLTSKDLVVVNTGNTAGEIYYGKDGILSNNLFKVSFDSNVLDTTYMFAYFSSQQFQNMLWSEMKEGTQPHLGHKIFGSKKLLVPPMELQQQFATFVEQTDKSKLVIQKSLDKLETLKKSLMQQYFG